MNKTFLTAVSAIAIMASGPAMAEGQKDHTSAKQGTEASAEASTGDLGKDVENAWENIKKDTSEAASKVSNAAEDAYNDAKQALNDDNSTSDFQTVNVDLRYTANGMIGQPVYNPQGERVAKIKDIILNSDGEAMMVIMGDGDFSGLGKTVAFDYDIITKRSEQGDVIAAMDEKMIDTAASFSYDKEATGENVRVIPQNGYSVVELLDGELVNPEGKTLANLDNVVFRNGYAESVVVSFGETLGLGGKQAAIAYGEADLKHNGDSIDMKLSANESTQFKQFKETALN